MRLEAARREFQAVKDWAQAPRELRLGCDMTAHKNIEFCSVCAQNPHLELNGWRLLAMIREEEEDGTTQPQEPGALPPG